jgi:integrase
MAALRVQRIDFLRRRALIAESVTPVKGVMVFSPTKGHERREVPTSRFASGADVKVVQQMLGHKSAVMTLDQYGHLFPDRPDVVADAMDAARVKAPALSRRSPTASEMCHDERWPNCPRLEIADD